MFEVVLRPGATRALRESLPPAVAGAVIELLAGPLRTAPRAVGTPLVGPYAGWLAIRRGEYRVLYEVLDDQGIVRVLRIGHRRDVYRGTPDDR